MNTLDKKKQYTSPSRFLKYLFNKKEFIERYVFKVKPAESRSMIFGSRMHDLFQNFFRDEKDKKQIVFLPYFYKRTKQGKQDFENFCLKNENSIILENDEKDLLIEFELFTKDFKRRVGDRKFAEEVFIYNDDLKTQGYLDLRSIEAGKENLAIEFKTSSKSVKFEVYQKYLIQKYFYKITSGDDVKFVTFNKKDLSFEFLNLEMNLDHMDHVMKHLIGSYQEFCDKIKEALNCDFFIENYKGSKEEALHKIYNNIDYHKERHVSFDYGMIDRLNITQMEDFL